MPPPLDDPIAGALQSCEGWRLVARYQLRFWGRIPELANRCLRAVTLADRVTVHNAFPDRGFKP